MQSNLQEADKPFKKKSKISTASFICIIVGSCIGSGIFFKNKLILEMCRHSVVITLLMWSLIGLAILCISYSLREVSSSKEKNPQFGYISWNETFNSRYIFKVSKYFIFFLYWPIIVYTIAMFSTEAFCDAVAWYPPWYYFLLIIFLISTWFFFTSGVFIKFATIQGWLLMFIKFVPILLVIGFGINHLANEKPANDWWLSPTITKSPKLFDDLNIGFGVIACIPAILFAFNGFQYYSSLKNDMKKPQKFNLAILIALIIVGIIYVLISLFLVVFSVNGDVNGLKEFLQKNKIEWVYTTIQLLISISMLSVLNGSIAASSKGYTSLIQQKEILFNNGFNKVNTNTQGALYGWCVFLFFCILIPLVGAWFPNTSGVMIFNEIICGIISLVDILSNWLALFCFVICGFSIYGCLKNRKTNKIKVVKSKHFVLFSSISLFLIWLSTIDTVISSFANLFIVGGYYNNHHNALNELIGSILTVGMLILYITICCVPSYYELHHENKQILRNKKIGVIN